MVGCGVSDKSKSSRRCDYRAVIGEYFLSGNRKGRKSGSFCLSLSLLLLIPFAVKRK